MRIADIHTRRVVHTSATASVREAAELMRDTFAERLAVALKHNFKRKGPSA